MTLVTVKNRKRWSEFFDPSTASLIVSSVCCLSVLLMQLFVWCRKLLARGISGIISASIPLVRVRLNAFFFLPQSRTLSIELL